MLNKRSDVRIERNDVKSTVSKVTVAIRCLEKDQRGAFIYVSLHEVTPLYHDEYLMENNIIPSKAMFIID